MKKKLKTPLSIFIESIGLYFSNIDKFLKYMTFPVLGQFLGLSLTLVIAVFYSKNLPVLIDKFPNLNNLNSLLLLSILVLIPGLAIFTKALWEYIVAYGAINSMLNNLLKSGRVYDFEAHTQLIKQRRFEYIGLWSLVALFSLLASFPLLWVIGSIFAVYFVLVFQAFTYSQELSPIGCAKKSFSLIKGKFLSTFMLLALIGTLTYFFIPQLFVKLAVIMSLDKLFVNIIQPIIVLLPIDAYNQIFTIYGFKSLSSTEVALFFVNATIAQIFIQYTLPMRTILWALWYKELDNGASESSVTSTTQKIKKRPSEKLMEASKKKYGKKKLDRNLIERASKKDVKD